MCHTSIDIVQAWQDAANRQEVDRILELSDPNVEIAGPRGSGHGHQLLRDWLGRAGLQLETQRIFARGNVVVLAQHGVWRAVDTREVTGERDLASCFHVDGQRVTHVERCDSLDVALAKAGITHADETAPNR